MAGTPDLIDAFEELCEARPAYAKAEDFYAGDVEEVYASDKVAKMLAKSGLNDLDEINFARTPVDAVANRLHIANITTGDEQADKAIAELMQRNELDQEIPGLHTRACTYGDTYLMVWPASDADGRVVGVDMFHNSPTTVRLMYDAENPLRKAFAIKSWTVGHGRDQVTRANLYYADRIERWQYKGKISKRDLWQPFDDDGQDAVLPNPWGEVPFFHFRTRRPYGLPEHYAAYGPQCAINKLIVSHLATVDFQSLPQRYGLIDPAVDPSGQQSDWDPDYPEDVDADPQDPLNPSQLRNDPGEMWMLQGLKGVGQFQAADPDVYLKPFDRYVRAMAQVTDTPFHFFDPTGDSPSGESLRVAEAPLVAKVEARQQSFGATWSQAFAFALYLLGFDAAVDVRWKPAQSVTDAEGWATIAAKISAGVPRERALIEGGYPPEQVEGWMRDLDDDAELSRRIGLLEQIGTAVQALGAGVQLEAITAGQVQTLLERVLVATESLGEAEANR